MKKALVTSLAVNIVLLIAIGVVGFLFYWHTPVVLTSQQRGEYLQIAVDYEAKAKETQAQADEISVRVSRAFPTEAKRVNDLASEYRQQALEYRKLAAK